MMLSLVVVSIVAALGWGFWRGLLITAAVNGFWWRLDATLMGYVIVPTIVVEFLVLYLLARYLDEKPIDLYDLLMGVAVGNLITFQMGWALRLWI